MLYQLYFKTRAYFVRGLVDYGWQNTLFFLQNLGQLDAVYAVASVGSLSERVERLSRLQALGRDSEEDKNCFAQGLMKLDENGKNIINQTASSIKWSPHAIQRMLTDLDSVGFFSGTETKARISVFLQALFAYDFKRRSAFLCLLDTNYLNSLSLLLEKLFKHSAFTKEHKDYFYNALKTQDHFLFRQAAKNLYNYSLIRQVLLQAGCSSWQLAKLLNTSHRERIFGEEIQCTPLMRLIYNNISCPAVNHAEFVSLLLRFRADGAYLSTTQAQMMRRHLEEIKEVTSSSIIQHSLLNDYITMLESIARDEPRPLEVHTAEEEPRVEAVIAKDKQKDDEVFSEDDAEALRVLNLV